MVARDRPTRGGEVLVSGDADASKTVADELGVSHQVCYAHVTKNGLRLVGELGIQALEASAPISQGVNRSVEQFMADLKAVQRLVEAHPHDGEEQSEAVHQHYCQTPDRREGEETTM